MGACIGQPSVLRRSRNVSQCKPRTKVLWIKEQYLQQILGGRKTVEIRVSYPNIQQLKPGDILLLNEKHRVVIRRIERYASFAELVAHEDPSAIAPGLRAEELLEACRAIYPPEKEALGAVALEINLLGSPGE